jgi:hypothetical protein
MEATLRTLRIVHGAMMIAAFMYVWLAEKLNAGHSPRDIKAMYVGIAAITLLMVFSALFLRRRFVAQSAELLRVDANNSAAVMRWRTGQIVSQAPARFSPRHFMSAVSCYSSLFFRNDLNLTPLFNSW